LAEKRGTLYHFFILALRRLLEIVQSQLEPRSVKLAIQKWQFVMLQSLLAHRPNGNTVEEASNAGKI
jgi:hypothetical protein